MVMAEESVQVVLPENLRNRAAITVPEFGDALGISRAQAFNLVARGEVTSFTIGRSRRIAMAELQKYIQRLLAEQGATA